MRTSALRSRVPLAGALLAGFVLAGIPSPAASQTVIIHPSTDFGGQQGIYIQAPASTYTEIYSWMDHHQYPNQTGTTMGREGTGGWGNRTNTYNVSSYDGRETWPDGTTGTIPYKHLWLYDYAAAGYTDAWTFACKQTYIVEYPAYP